MKIVELIPLPGTQYHFGEILPDGEVQSMNAVTPFPPSDLLFSALVNIWNKVFGDASGLVKRFEENEIQLSSAFFFIRQNAKTIRFLPKPVVAGLLKTDEHKKLKKIMFVSEAIITNGILPDDWLDPDKCTLIDGRLLCLSSELSGEAAGNIPVYKEITVPKVKVHTTDEEHRLYNQTNNLFPLTDTGIETGYYFYLNESLPADEKQKLNTVLNLLADEGLGGDRSSGCGQFRKVRLQTCESVSEKSSGYYLSVSLSNPAENERDAFEYYQLIIRGGRETNGYGRLKLVNMIAEGAIVSRPVSGRIVDISPNGNGDYLRYGKTFLIPLDSKFETLWKKNQSI